MKPALAQIENAELAITGTTNAKLNFARQQLKQAAELVAALRSTLPVTLYVAKCVHPDVLKFAEADYEEALAVYLVCQGEAVAAKKAARFAVP